MYTLESLPGLKFPEGDGSWSGPQEPGSGPEWPPHEIHFNGTCSKSTKISQNLLLARRLPYVNHDHIREVTATCALSRPARVGPAKVGPGFLPGRLVGVGLGPGLLGLGHPKSPSGSICLVFGCCQVYFPCEK